MRRVLVTGFGPFEGVTVNASELLARGLCERLRGGGVAAEALGLETAYGAARARLARAVLDREARGEPFDLVIALGVARSEVVRLERVARAEVTSERADVRGEVWQGQRLGERDLESPLPLGRWCEALGGEAAGVVVSDDAGGYVCNALLHQVASTCPDRGIFVHVPGEALPGTPRFQQVLLILERLTQLTLDELGRLAVGEEGGEADAGGTA